MHTTDGITKIESCEYAPVNSAGACVAPLRDDAGGDCRRDVDLRPGAKVCSTGYGIVGGKCIRYEAASIPAPQCPTGSVEDGSGDCRKPVADAKGAYYCKDANAALNGKSCVWTTGFLIEPSPTLYKCDAGARTVIGSGSATDGTGSAVQVICILGDANANTLIFPNLSSGNITYKVLQSLGTAEAIGPILMGMKKPVHILQRDSSVREIINMTAIAVIDAQAVDEE